jgi:DHA1 family inner membrane transport protein
MMPLSDILMEVFKLNPMKYSFIVSSYMFGACISGFSIAFFIDRFDRKKALVWTYIGFILGTVACAVAWNYELLMAARILSGIFGGIMGTLIIAIFGDAIAPERRSTAMGFVIGAFSIASVVGVPFGLYIAQKFQWHTPFWFLAVISLFVLAGIWYWVPNISGHVAKAKLNKPYQVFINISRDKNQQRALFFSMLLMLGQFTIVPFIARYMVKNVGFEQSQLYLIYLIGGALTIFTSPYFGNMSDRKGNLKIYTIFGLINCVPIFLITNLPPVPVYVALCVTGVFFVTSNARFIPAQSMITSVVKPEERGGFMSINSSVQSLANFVAPLIAGLIITETPGTKAMIGYQYAGYVAIAASIGAVIISQRIRPVA